VKTPMAGDSFEKIATDIAKATNAHVLLVNGGRGAACYRRRP
jgi:hypothetical protein